MRVVVVILTKNEELHIERCLKSVATFAYRSIVVDSGSTDRTVELAKAAGAEVLLNPWVNYSTQMNWGIDRVPEEADWVMRLDADEVVSEGLATEINDQLPQLDGCIEGVFVQRRMCFLGKPIRWGGVFPIKVLRLFRLGKGQCEDRWMDEHILVSGATKEFKGELLDDNRKSLTWWVEKHNSYASREVVDILNGELGFMPFETIADIRGGQASAKRWVKENVYSRLPSGVRALLYFIYRYWVRFGFLDGKRGALFHVLQGYWYRYLVDAKLYEVKRHMAKTGDSPKTAVKLTLGIDLDSAKEITATLNT